MKIIIISILLLSSKIGFTQEIIKNELTIIKNDTALYGEKYWLFDKNKKEVMKGVFKSYIDLERLKKGEYTLIIKNYTTTISK